jgi:SAM-dependent methyltransferase
MEDNKPQQKAMDFLPADQKDLQTSEYWKKFFEFDRFKDGFEWYASFEDLMPYIQQFIKTKEGGQRIIVPGCGNSNLSQKLLTKLGVSDLDVYSVDYESSVVEKMNETKPADLKLTFAVGDVTNLSDCKKQEFNYSIDKGTLDAIAVDEKEETVTMCHNYFKEMVRLLDNGGVFMIVSLLQPHVLKIMLDFFVKGNDKSNLFAIRF